ncbi:MAG: M48 family metallopeptidase [Cyanobacteria bacterium P01_A01_bin.84]
MNQGKIFQLAKEGSPEAIAILINSHLKPKGITSKVILKQNCLLLKLESTNVPNQEKIVAYIRKTIINLGITSIEIIKIYGWQIGEEFPAWSQELEIILQNKSQIKPELLPKDKPKNKSHNKFHNKSHKYTINKRIHPSEYRFKGEKEVLYGSLVVLGLIFFVFLGISFGLIIIMVGISAFWVKIREGELLGRGVKVSENQLPFVYEAAKIAAERLSMKVPDIFVIQSPILNAFAIGFLTGRKTVVLHSALIEILERDELIAIIGHEFSHIKCHHTNWLVLTNTAENLVKLPIISNIAGFVFLLWSRKAEYTCDHGGLIACQNLNASISALAKLTIGNHLYSQMNLNALIQQKKDVDTNDMSKISEIFATHPHTVNRIHQLNQFYSSGLYKKLICS